MSATLLDDPTNKNNNQRNLKMKNIITANIRIVVIVTLLQGAQHLWAQSASSARFLNDSSGYRNSYSAPEPPQRPEQGAREGVLAALREQSARAIAALREATAPYKRDGEGNVIDVNERPEALGVFTGRTADELGRELDKATP